MAAAISLIAVKEDEAQGDWVTHSGSLQQEILQTREGRLQWSRAGCSGARPACSAGGSSACARGRAAVQAASWFALGVTAARQFLKVEVSQLFIKCPPLESLKTCT